MQNRGADWDELPARVVPGAGHEQRFRGTAGADTQRGGTAGGGAGLTTTGERVLSIYRAIERDAERTVTKRLPKLLALIRPEASEVP